ncbi:hypothetical protein D3C78_1550370 [compost metagenome]
MIVCLSLLTLSYHGARLAGARLPLFICQGIADAGQGRQIDLRREVILFGCQGFALL